MDDNTSIQFRLRLAQINGIKMNEEQIHEAAITHVLPKKEVAGHIKRVEDAYNRVHGKDYKIVPLPAEHPLAKTHAGIVFKNRSERHVSDHYNLWGKSNVEKLDRSIPVNLRKSGPVKTNEEQLSETNHQRIDESLDHITRITQALKDPNPDVRRNAISHRLATPKHITQALEDQSSDVRVAAINHPNVTPKHITHALKDKVMAVRIVAIKHPKATPEHITQALKDGDRYVRQAALKHHNVTSEHITQAVKDPNPDVRRNAITHHLATPEHLEQGMKDPDGSVRTVASIIHKRDHDPITDAARPQHLGDKD